MTDDLNLQLLVVWGLSALGCYHLLQQAFRALPLLRRRRGHRAWTVIEGSRRADGDGQAWDAASQLRHVMGARYTARKVMSLAEYDVFKLAEQEARAAGGCRVFSQTALGEVLESDDKRAFSAINVKRVDVLIIGPSGYPLVAIEYQGGGHFQKDAAARDAIKKEALRKAGVEYVEIFDFQNPEQRRTAVREALARRRTRTDSGAQRSALTA